MKVLCFHSPFFKIINVNFLLSSSLRFFCMVIFGSDHNWNFAFYRVVRRNPPKLNIAFWKQIILYFCSNIQIRTTRCYWSLPVPLPSPLVANASTLLGGFFHRIVITHTICHSPFFPWTWWLREWQSTRRGRERQRWRSTKSREWGGRFSQTWGTFLWL